MQTEIAWDEGREPRLAPTDREWVHEEGCDCGVCILERARLFSVRREHYAGRAPETVIAARVAYYARRVEEDRYLFQQEPDEDPDEYAAARAAAQL